MASNLLYTYERGLNLDNLMSQIHPFLRFRVQSGFGFGVIKGNATFARHLSGSGLFKKADVKSFAFIRSRFSPLTVKSTVPNRTSLTRGVNCMFTLLIGELNSLKYDYQFYSDVDRHPSTTAG
jgi:hypothetical protein